MSPLYKSVGALAAVLNMFLPTLPVCVMVGKFKCAPIRLELKCMTEDLRRAWWDAHSDSSCVWVMTLREGSEEEEEKEEH